MAASIAPYAHAIRSGRTSASATGEQPDDGRERRVPGGRAAGHDEEPEPAEERRQAEVERAVDPESARRRFHSLLPDRHAGRAPELGVLVGDGEAQELAELGLRAL